jgi:hypothetical protein
VDALVTAPGWRCAGEGAPSVHRKPGILGSEHGQLGTPVRGAHPIELSRWNGTRWASVGTTSSSVSALASWNADIHIAGSFTHVNGVSSVRIGRYSGCACYANCDASTTPPILNVLDFSCFLNRFAAGDPYANCDGSTTDPVLTVLDFACFLNRYAAGCP